MKKITGLAVIFALLSAAAALPEASRQYKRLILKDGSYERISSCEIQGDRVRYFSSERYKWEELPAALIDWPATDKFAAEEASRAAGRKSEALDRAARERSEEEAHTPLVAPGIRIPSPDGAYLLDQYQDRAELNPLRQNGSDLNRNVGRNILRGVINPIAGPKQTLELPGRRARLQSHTASPSIFFPIDPGDDSRGYDSLSARNHLRIVRCEEKEDKRVVAALNIALYGKVRKEADFIEADVERISDYWVRVTPEAPLAPGEYALVEFDGKGAMNMYVWDFGVNPDAPANPDALQQPDPDRSEPVLILKPRKK